jgi:replication factor C subunit 2/4
MREGYSASQTRSQVSDLSKQLNLSDIVVASSCTIILHLTLPARQKARCALAFAEADKALCDGADEEPWVESRLGFAFTKQLPHLDVLMIYQISHH